MRVATALCICSCLALAGLDDRVAAQAPVASAGLPADLPQAISRLGSLDYATRMNAARFVRRAPEPEAVAALTAAVRESADEFIRYRALVLLTGFGDRPAGELMRAMAADRNDRVREVAYRWMAAHPQDGSTDLLLAALQTEQAEFVRPALVQALAARGTEPQVRRALVSEVARGQDFFRLGVIDALGEFRAQYAQEAVAAVARVEGPLQDDAVMALGRIGDPRTDEVLSALPSTPEVAVAARAAICLLGRDCEAAVRSIADVLVASGSRPEAARSAVTALTVLSVSGSDLALSTLADLSRSSRVQALATVGFGGAALRNPDRVLTWLLRQPAAQQASLVEVLRAAFERFEEDYSEERFFVATRAAYWRAAEGSSDRNLMASLIQRLEF